MSRPMPSIGFGCHELRIIEENVTWRVIYAVEVDAIVVLEVLAKKTNKTPREVLSNCERRLKASRTT
jgi:phage-related protein